AHRVVRPRSRRRGLAREPAHPTVRAGGEARLRPEADAQAAVEARADRAPDRQDGGARALARSDPPVLLPRAREGGDRARQGEAAVREAPGDRRTGDAAGGGALARPPRVAAPFRLPQNNESHWF